MRKYLVGMVMMLLGFALQTSVVEAHTPNVNHNCAGVSWQFSSYEHANATVTVDGVVVASKTDFKNWSGSHPWDQTLTHTYEVRVDDVGTQWDKVWSSTQANCQQPSTTSTSSSTTSTTSSSSTTTSTTEASTTTSTTVPSSSSSTLPSESTTTGPTTTSTFVTEPTVISSTSSTVMVGEPPTTPMPPAAPPTGSLPETGPSEVKATLGWGLIATGAGVLVVLLARRPRNA